MALCAALLFALQVALAGLPNIELVSLLVILFTRAFEKRALIIIYAFVLLEVLMYGVSTWVVNYLYIWTVLWAIAYALRRNQDPLFWAVISGAFGLGFGLLCAVPYLFIGGFSMAASYWVSGVPFDLAHCAGNFVAALVLFKPLSRAVEAGKRIAQKGLAG